jgi:CRISPR-associated endonuclease/helicase Cas3
MKWETMTESSSCDLFSHPGKKLRDHLTAVADYCESIYLGDRPDFSSLGLSYDSLVLFSRTLGLCHDFGKATTYFQRYLLADEKEQSHLKIKETQHGQISAIFTYHCLKEMLLSIPNTDKSLLPFIGYVLVRHHHGDLHNFYEEVDDLKNSPKSLENKELLTRQINAITKNNIPLLYKNLISERIIDRFFLNFNEIISSLARDGNRFRLEREFTKITESSAMEIFTLYFYSLLLEGDKLDAAGISVERNRGGLRADLVDIYRKNQGFAESGTPMNRLRNEIYEDVISKVGTLDLKEKIYSLNVPTGTGKTLTSVSFALKLRERISHETGITPQIVYCLPFMSIIDQNYDVISSVFSSSFPHEIPTDILLKHHHLADISYTASDDENYDEDASRLLIEGWHSEFIITTFVQFFHTILSNRNRAIKKYHTLANSIIILDEVQSIPHHYWLLFHDLLQTLSCFLNIHVVFVTATQPLIFDEENQGEIRELASNKRNYFSRLDRVNLTFNREPKLLQDFIKEIQDRIRTESGKDFLIVLNTINSAKDVYRELSSGSASDADYVFLSTHIIPKERLIRIRALRDPMNKKRKVIVSTQLIEAGVDIDVDVVYRDMAPLDSINQVSGRCNRNNREDVRGEVQVVTLKNNEKELCKFIYPSFLLDKTRIVLEGKDNINEQQFLALNNQYFRLVKELHSEDLAQNCFDLIRYLKFSDLHDTFHLIENDYPKMDVFVECDDTARMLWQKFVEIKSKPLPERRKDFLKLKREFLDHVVSVPEKYAKGLFRKDLGIGHISHEELKIWYNPETGFSPNDGGIMIV